MRREKTIQTILQGAQRFEREIFPAQRRRFKALAGAQYPKALFITCSDSRIDPNLVLQARPGELFHIRNAGNIVPRPRAAGGEAATIEFAIRGLGIRHVIVCGHTDCGAMKALRERDQLGVFPAMQAWLKHAELALRVLPKVANDGRDAQIRALIEENVLVQMENLRAHPVIAEGLEAGQVHLLGCLYDIPKGRFLIYVPAQGKFVPAPEVDVAELELTVRTEAVR